jgi:hypothetical protein
LLLAKLPAVRQHFFEPCCPVPGKERGLSVESGASVNLRFGNLNPRSPLSISDPPASNAGVSGEVGEWGETSVSGWFSVLG